MLPPFVALFLWPLVGVVLFYRLERRLAILVTLIAGYLLLPELTALDLPALPALDKHSIPALTVLLGLALTSGRAVTGEDLTGFLPKSGLLRLMLGMAVGGAFMTVMTNGDALYYGNRVLPGLRPYDGFSAVLAMIMMLLPMLLARRYLADSDSHILILKALCVAGLAYSLLALFEIRMSPQLNQKVYGFFPHGWAIHVRGSGYRPLVFLQQGLLLAIFFSAAITAALGLSRIEGTRRGKFLLAGLWLLATLVLSKSLGALLITLAVIPVVLILNSRLQLLVAALLGALILLYPVVRSSGIVPLDQIEQMAASIDAQRASSFRTRLDNEDILIAKSVERPVFGWGGWGRSRVYNELGEDISITDGHWVITIGVGGWVRYIAEFGLLTVPIFLMFFNRHRFGIGLESSLLALILAGNLVDMIPNASLTPLTWLVGGALWGRLELRDRTPNAAGKEQVPTKDSRGYSRPPTDVAEAPDASATSDSPKNPYTRQTERIYRDRTPPD